MYKLRAIASWPIVGWMCYVFLGSLPYKFTNHPDTQHIFGTIGDWLGTFLGNGTGRVFREYGAYAVGGFELLTSLVLLAPALLWLVAKARPGAPDGARAGDVRRRLHTLGGLMASAVMSGAVFFHVFSPLGIEVLHEGQGDGGSLFRAAVSVLVLGVVLFLINVGDTRGKRA